MPNYWLHRISYCSFASYPLLEEGYLTIGFGEVVGEDPDIANKVQDGSLSENEFDNILEQTYNKKGRNRKYLWHFLHFAKGDIVVVPSWGKFAIYEVTECARSIDELPITDIKDWYGRQLFIKKGYGLRAAKSDDIQYDEQDKNTYDDIDLGFYVKVKPLTKYEGGEFAPRDKFLENSILKRLKFRGTTADLNDLKDDVNKAIERVNKNESIDFYKNVVEQAVPALQKTMQEIPNDRTFEKLVEWYLKKVGGSQVYIASKNNPDAQDYADVDVVAFFDVLGITILVQVKQHIGTTGEWAVKQIKEYIEQQADNTQIGWVITAADDFTEEAKQLAIANNIRLINGKDFAQMLLDVGLLNINDALVK